MMLRKIRTFTLCLGFVTIALLTLYGGMALFNSAKSVSAAAASQHETAKSALTMQQMTPTLTVANGIPLHISYQGILQDREGKPLSGYYTMTLRLYDDATAPITDAIYASTLVSVTVRDGHFSVLLGDQPQPPLPATLFDSPNRFMGVTVAGFEEMMPHQRFASVLYAIQAGHAYALSGQNGEPYTAVWMDQGKVRIGNIEGPHPPVVSNDAAQVTIENQANNQWGMLVTSSTGQGSAYGLKIKTAWPGHTDVPLFLASAGWGDQEVPRFIIQANGNVGIGTQVPEAKLHIDQIDNNKWGMIITSPAGSAQGLKISTGYPEHPDIPIFQANAGCCGNELQRFVIEANGNVGIGTQVPEAKLDVAGTMRVGTSDQAFPALFAGEIQLGVNGRVGVNGNGKNDPGNTAGIWFADIGASHHAFVGTSLHDDKSQVGFYAEHSDGESAGWGLVMDTKSGDVGIGTTLPQAKLDVAGTTRTQILQITGGSDLAELFTVTGSAVVEPGMVVAIDPDHPGMLRIANHAYDRTVAGVVSGAGGIHPGLTLQQQDTPMAAGEHPVALTGRVYIWADASNGAIQPGDLLTTSDTVGHAMKVTDYEQAQGAILGKAMTTLESGKGLVLVLIALQ